ncbi:hypothetical protein [Serratia symbiotica]|uniref:hypothetical protein n=1 Tax=Serratia symbiotica TaxID=138074 RepID=UPI001CF07D67|nr:hypothetical protein [Serratia symbiotica]
MDIIIKGTNDIKTFELTDSSGADWVKDFVGNGTLEFTDGQFVYDDDIGAFVCEQGTYDWWSKVISDQQEMQDRIAALVDEHGHDAVYAAIGDASAVDIGDEAASVNAALDEAFGTTAE